MSMPVVEKGNRKPIPAALPCYTGRQRAGAMHEFDCPSKCHS